MQLLEDEPQVWNFPSCEPGRFKGCRLDVVRWGSRVPRGNKPITVPAGLKLAILTRGRVRLPFRSIKWLLALGRATSDPRMTWAHRLPPNYELTTILAEVDVTVELFVILPALRTSEVNNIIGTYLKQRHATEIANCKSRFLYTWDSVSSKTVLENRLSEGCPSLVSLSPMFTQANIKMPSAMDWLELKSFILVCYASFPNDIDLHLKPVKPSGGTAEERTEGHLRRFVEEFVPLDDEDKEMLCLVEKLIAGAKDEFTSRQVAQAYADGQFGHFRSSLRTALKNNVKTWNGTNMARFTKAVRNFNLKAQTGLSKIDQLANEDIYHSWPAVKEMWAWRNKALRDPNHLMNCYVSKLRR